MSSIRYLAALVMFSSSLGAQTATVTHANASAPSVDARVKALHDLLDEQWEYTLRTAPEYASILGDKRYNDRLSDFSQAAIDRDIVQSRVFLTKFEAINTA